MTYNELKKLIETSPALVAKLQSINIGQIGDMDKPRDEAIQNIKDALYKFGKNTNQLSIVTSLEWSLQSIFPKIEDCDKGEPEQKQINVNSITHTDHQRYAGKNLFEAFNSSKKGGRLLSNFQLLHPESSIEDLVIRLNQDLNDIPIVYASTSNPDYVWNSGGNNRLIVSKTLDAVIGLNHNELTVDYCKVDHDISSLLELDKLVSELLSNDKAKVKFINEERSIFIFSGSDSYRIPTKYLALIDFISTLETQRKPKWKGALSYFRVSAFCDSKHENTVFRD